MAWFYKIYDSEGKSHYFQNITAAVRGKNDYGSDEVYKLQETKMTDLEIEALLRLDVTRMKENGS